MHASNDSPRRPAVVTRRRALAAGSLAAIAPTLLTACGSRGEQSSAGGAGLTFMNQSRGQEAALTALAEKYSSENGIEITIDSPGPADYLPKLQARAQSKSMPDIYSSFNATDMAAFYKAGWAMELTSELEGGWSEDFSPAVLEMSTFEDGNLLGVDPGVYTVHWETQAYGLLVNPDLVGFDQDSMPGDAAEFIAALQTADSPERAFSVASNLVPPLLQGLASNFLTDEEIAATFSGTRSWQDPAWEAALQFLVDLKDGGVLANNSLPGGQGDNADVEADFFTGSLGSIFNASPSVAVGLATNPDFDSYFTVAPPRLAEGTLDPRSPGIPGKGAVINPRGERAAEALEFVKWLTKPEQQKFFADEARILPTNPGLLESGEVPVQLEGFASQVETLQVMSDTFTVDVNTAIITQAQSVVIGETSVEDALAAIQAAQDRAS